MKINQPIPTVIESRILHAEGAHIMALTQPMNRKEAPSTATFSQNVYPVPAKKNSQIIAKATQTTKETADAFPFLFVPDQPERPLRTGAGGALSSSSGASAGSSSLSFEYSKFRPPHIVKRIDELVEVQYS